MRVSSIFLLAQPKNIIGPQNTNLYIQQNTIADMGLAQGKHNWNIVFLRKIHYYR